MSILSINSFEEKQLKITQWITVALTIALFFSAPAVNVFEVLLILSVLSSRTLRNRLTQALQSPLCITALIFYVIIIFAATYSIAHSKEAWGMVSGWRKIILLPFAYAALHSKESKDLVLKTFLITAIACLGWSFLSFNFPSTFFYTNLPGIIIKNHATQGMFFGIAILIALVFALQSGASSIFRLFLLILIALMLLNIATITIGRSGYVIVTTSLLCFSIYKMHRHHFVKQLLIFGLVGILTTGFFLSSKTSRDRIYLGINEFTQPKTEGNAGSMGVRHYWWIHSVNMIKKNPILGIGTGAFEEGLNQEINGLSGPIATKTNDPHNQYLKILVEQGIIGFIALLAIIFSAFTAKSVSQPYRLVGLTVLTGWCITSLANSHFSTFHEGHFIWFWLGAMLASEK
jgi:O-antigen ligase